ncbi:MAG: NAD-dependent epimerase/dehydratase family protein, partial [Desulfosarcinaceae bacterium]|nr:NAD-dependent epimerase/dehydratase family protein [Desulfosarcinaceae bacterium]
MHIFITGGSGFIGTYLAKHFLEADDSVQITATGGRRRHPNLTDERFTYLSADTTEPGPWQEDVPKADLILNLAGRTIFHPWTENYKTKLRTSRVRTTRHLVAALPDAAEALLLSASAVGFYGSCGESVLTETSPRGDDFLAKLSEEWEAEALAAEEKG